MMGRLKHDQGQLFYSFCLEDVVPSDHRVREIAAVLDLSWVHGELAPYYSNLGRPSIDPVLMIRMLILGYVFAIRSERLLCREVQVNLAYRWFCGLSIEDKIPDHSAFSRARNERFRDSDIFRRVFERVVEACIVADLVGGEGFAVDASLIAADANKQRSIPGSDWDKKRDPETASRAVKEYLATLDDAAFGTASEVNAEVRLTVRSGRTVDRCDAGTGVFRLRRQLSDRREVRHHHGCRSYPCHPPGRGGCSQDHDRADRGALRLEA
jgi:transposase